jgi:biotin transporter BioY
LPVVGFAASAIVFDLLMSANHHRIYRKVYNMVVAALATAISAYFAGVVIGIFVMNQTVEWTLTFWSGWHLIGGIISATVALPLIGILEKANVRKVKAAS